MSPSLINTKAMKWSILADFFFFFEFLSVMRKTNESSRMPRSFLGIAPNSILLLLIKVEL